jgi:hypothetical protein
MKAENFCKYLTNQIKLEFDSVMPCCWISKRTDFNDLDHYRTWVDTNENWDEVCGYCLNLEKKNIRSPRNSANSNPLRLFRADPETDTKRITSIEIQIDNECNAACIMCGPWSSTTWAKFNVSADQTMPIKVAKDLIIEESRNKATTRLNKLMEKLDFSNLKQVVFLGGEPFLNHAHIRVIDCLSQHVPVDKLHLRYLTNASQDWSSEHLEVIKKSKFTHMVFSVDAVSQLQFNYHRWPLQWHQVHENIRQFLSLKLPNVGVGFSVTLTPLNIYYADQIETWITNLHKEFPGIITIDSLDMFFHPAIGTFDPTVIPPQLRQLLAQKYGRYHKVCKLIAPFDAERYKQFINFVNQQDKKRNLNWRQTFPEIQHCFPDKDFFQSKL